MWDIIVTSYCFLAGALLIIDAVSVFRMPSDTAVDYVLFGGNPFVTKRCITTVVDAGNRVGGSAARISAKGKSITWFRFTKSSVCEKMMACGTVTILFASLALLRPFLHLTVTATGVDVDDVEYRSFTAEVV
jgi:hypothetical protein